MRPILAIVGLSPKVELEKEAGNSAEIRMRFRCPKGGTMPCTGAKTLPIIILFLDPLRLRC